MSKDRFYESGPEADHRRSAPAAQRNREPIAEVLADWLPKRGLVLEIGSGTGEHAVFFAERFPDLEWQPSDSHAVALRSIAAWEAAAGLPNLRPPVEIDSSAENWPVEHADALFSANMAHISPWEASLGLIAGASRLLPPGGPLVLYGPWLMDGIDTAPSNLEFDSDLKERDPRWGLRKVEDFAAAATVCGLSLSEWRRMPANNLMLLFLRNGG